MTLLLALFAISHADRGEWLCGKVRQMRARNPFSNAIGYRLGRLSYDVVHEIQNVVYPEGCTLDKGSYGHLGDSSAKSII